MASGGPLVAFELKGGKEAAFDFMNALEIFKITNNLGDSKSLVTHPATTTHQRLGPEGREAIGITDGMLRLSLGLEDPIDLLADIDHAFSA
jgi:O-succinylhomoserine sulfhydrylase